jgi:hypothetical protein
MMSAIKVGDLVMVVKPSVCCGSGDDIGQLFISGETYSGIGICGACGNNGEVNAVWKDADNVKELSRLIKIDPPALPESIETEKEITA